MVESLGSIEFSHGIVIFIDKDSQPLGCCAPTMLVQCYRM